MKTLRAFCLLAMLSSLLPLLGVDLSALPEDGWDTYPFQADSSDEVATWYKEPKKEKKKTKQSNLFLLEVGAVYLRPYQGGTDFAELVAVDQFTDNGTEPYGKNKTLDFDYDWGVRGGIGYQGGKSRQTINATYLYFATDAHKTSTGGATSGALTPIIQGGGGTSQGINIGSVFTSAKTHWNLHFNMLDLTFGKKYPKKGCMSFEPFVGVKGIILSETQKYSFTNQVNPSNGLSSNAKQKAKFKGAGVMGGLNLNWSMTNWLSFLGAFDAALLYSSIETKRNSDNNLPTLMWVGSSHDVKGTPVLDAMFAVRAVYCWKSGKFINLKVGFEEHYVFQTMKHFVLNSDSSTDLSLMGWFATLGFGF